jgi:hypothetical protein
MRRKTQLEPKQQKKIVNNLKGEWKKLWLERLDDKVRAEGVATNDYSQLFIEKGTIIHATRDYKALNFTEILERHQIENAERYVPPSPTLGGWGKFVKTSIVQPKTKVVNRTIQHHSKENVKQQPKKSGRGWLHK